LSGFIGLDPKISDYESGGQEFESLRARQQLFDLDSEILRDFSPLDIGIVRGSTGATPCKILAANYAPDDRMGIN
jgi:hypothetical protein